MKAKEKVPPILLQIEPVLIKGKPFCIPTEVTDTPTKKPELKTEPDLKPKNCTKCGKMYNHNCNLQRHLRYECGKEPQFQCTYCKFRFKRKDTLKKHCFVLHNKVL